MAQLAIRDKALSALLACTVVSEPPWPVFKACSRSAASRREPRPPRYDPGGDAARDAPDPGSSPPFLQAAGLESDAIRALDAKL